MIHRLSVRLFASYLVVVLVSTGIAFVTARALAPTFFRVNLEQGRPDDIPSGSTIGPGGPLAPGGSGPTTGPGGTGGSGSTEPGRPAPGGPGGPGEPDGPGSTRGSGSTGSPGEPGRAGTPGAGGDGAGPTGTTASPGSQPSTTRDPGGGGPNGTPPPPGGQDTTSTPAGQSGATQGRGADAAVAAGILAAGAPEPVFVVDEEVSEAFRSAVNAALLVALAVSLLVAAGFSWLVTRRIMRPISAVRGATVRLAEGRYSERVPLPSDEELAGLARDVNRLAETLEATEDRRTRLISDVTHELRTPLTTIQGSMEGLIDGVLTPSDEVYASVADEASRLQRVVADLGLLSRLDESALVLQHEPTDLGAVAESVVGRLRPLFEGNQVRLVTSGLQGLVVSGDGDRLAQVLTNLIGNALGHTPAGGTVGVAGRSTDEMVEVAVSDTGEGIAAEHLEKIFDRFYRVPGGRRRGTGLGLTIARSIARAHGGDVTASSAGTGRGSRFALSLPVFDDGGGLANLAATATGG